MSTSDDLSSTSKPSEPAAKGQASGPERASSAKPMPQPKVPFEEVPPRQDLSPGSSASGFVGMLAKGKLGSGDSHMPELLHGSDEGKPPRRPKYQLRMAREIAPAGAAKRTPAGVKPHPAAKAETKINIPVQEEKHVSAVRAAGAVVLLAVGLWAAGALIYMSAEIPRSAAQVHYPLIRWRGMGSGFSRESWIIAWVLLACVPLAAAFFLGAVRRRKLRARD